MQNRFFLILPVCTNRHLLFDFRSVIREKEGKNADTNLTERFEMSIYEDPIGTYFEYKAQEEAWNDLDCKFLITHTYDS